MSKGEIKIYVACLAAYNNGILHGRWIEANQDPFDIWSEVSEMLLASPVEDAEEWAIHDHDGFEGCTVSEHAAFDYVSELAQFIDEQGALGGKLVEYYGSLSDARGAIEDHYAGEYESLSDFAQEITEQSTTIPDHIAAYVDYERMAQDLEINDVLAIETAFDEVHVFWAH